MDRIFEAYSGAMGAEFMHKTRERLHWICSQVWGTRVLDVGCSQGVAPVLMAKMGYSVDGIDVNGEAIAFAQEQLEKEPQDIRSRVTYATCDFARFSPPENRRYDVITMSEVLEHLVRPQDFIRKAFAILPEKGRLVITVPFGINDDPDHRQTFYLTSIYSLLHPLFEVASVKIFGAWVGLVGRRRAEEVKDAPVIPLSLMRQAEEAFFRIERPLRDGTMAVRNQRQELTRAQEKLADDLRAAEKARLEAEAKTAAADLSPVKSELAEVRGQLSASEGEVRTLQTSLEVERRMASGYQDQINVLKAMLQFITNQQKAGPSETGQEQRLLAYTQEARELRDANGELKVQLAVSNLERTHLAERLERVEATVSSAERRAAEAVETAERFEAESKALRDADAALRETIRNLDAEKVALAEGLEVEKTWAAQHKAEFDAYQAESERRNSALAAENAAAKKEIADLKSRLSAAERAADKELALHKRFSAEAYNANRQIAALNDRLAALEKELEANRERHEGLEKESNANRERLAAEQKACRKSSDEVLQLKRQLAVAADKAARAAADKRKAERAYNKLAKSKLGRLTLRYWAFKDRRKKPGPAAPAPGAGTKAAESGKTEGCDEDGWRQQRENESRFFARN